MMVHLDPQQKRMLWISEHTNATIDVRKIQIAYFSLSTLE